MRQLSAGMAAALVAFLTVRRYTLESGRMPESLIAVLAIAFGIVVAILARKGTKVAGARGRSERFRVCLVRGGVIAPLWFLLPLLVAYLLVAGPYWATGIGMWIYGLRAWVAGGVIGMAVAVFWPWEKQEAPGTAR